MITAFLLCVIIVGGLIGWFVYDAGYDRGWLDHSRGQPHRRNEND